MLKFTSMGSKPSNTVDGPSGWWLSPTPLKNMSSSVGMMTFPIYGKSWNSCSQPPTSNCFVWLSTILLVFFFRVSHPTTVCSRYVLVLFHFSDDKLMFFMCQWWLVSLANDCAVSSARPTNNKWLVVSITVPFQPVFFLCRVRSLVPQHP